MKHKLFRVKSTSKHPRYVSALDERHAIDIAWERKLARKKENLRILTAEVDGISLYEFFARQGDDMSEIDKKFGLCAKRIEFGKRNVWIVR